MLVHIYVSHVMLNNIFAHLSRISQHRAGLGTSFIYLNVANGQTWPKNTYIAIKCSSTRQVSLYRIQHQVSLYSILLKSQKTSISKKKSQKACTNFIAVQRA
jgi:hypothetical protein